MRISTYLKNMSLRVAQDDEEEENEDIVMRRKSAEMAKKLATVVSGNKYSLLPLNFAAVETTYGMNWLGFAFVPFDPRFLRAPHHILSEGELTLTFDWYEYPKLTKYISSQEMTPEFMQQVFAHAKQTEASVKSDLGDYLGLLEKLAGVSIPDNIKSKIVAEGEKIAKRRLSAKGPAKKTVITW